MELKTDGFDYWAISFTDNEIANPNQQTLKIRRAVFLYLMIEAALQNGIITEPNDFKNGIDYTTKIVKDNNQKDDPNYYMTRGFINIVNRNFKSREKVPSSISEYTNPSWEKEAYPYRDFLSYVRAAMFYTKTEFQEKYSPTTYPLINQRYEIVINHIQNNYGIDLEGIAKGPQE
ncbi:MAG: hypothetical protein KH112_10430 [Sanguibacteroides justesenii]|nr:hypothetical protein [Sanguibacteroides justesenii]